ncbi:MAG: hypothetical protein AAF525_07700 [Pseudomonadota bacterium]
MAKTFTEDQKQQLFDDGFVIIRNAVPPDISQRAKDLINGELSVVERQLLVNPSLTTHESVLALFNASCLADLLREEMGPFPPVISSQIAVTAGHDTLRGRPFPHVDGGWSGAIPTDPDEIDLELGRPRDAAQYFGEHDEVRGTNDGLLWQDKDRKVAMGSYTALVGVCLNDQTVPGRGQFAVMKGMHHIVEQSFRMQRRLGGPIGQEGPGFPRIRLDENGVPYMNGLPQMVRDRVYPSDLSKATKDWPWPELTPILLNQGDAVIAMHSIPHTPTPNLGPDPRMNIYFRIRRLREDNPHEGSRRLGHGVSDHLDRGYYGQYLEYPDEYDAFGESVERLCNIWNDWDGMQDYARQRASEDGAKNRLE